MMTTMFADSVRRHPDREAIVDGDERISYRVLAKRADQAAAGLTNLGIKPGDRIGIWSGNRGDALCAVMACLRLGAVAVPLGHRLQTPEVAYMLHDSGARILVVEDALAPRVPEYNTVPSLEQVFILGEVTSGGRSYSELENEEGEVAPPGDDEEALAFLMYTSGTTGKPKGAMITHVNLVHSVLHYTYAMRLTFVERSLLAVPFTHITGLVAQTLTMLGIGGKIVVLREFKADAAAALLHGEAVTHSVMVPAMYNLILRLETLPKLPNFRVAAYGGAPVPEAIVTELVQKFPNAQPMNAYGSTETTSPATLLPPARAREKRASVGLPVHCADIRVCDEGGDELPSGSEGEICIGGPMVVPGYWNLEEATRKGFRNGMWLSGDIGRMDEEGFVEVLDRSKDMINRGGYKIFSAEVESLLAECDGVLEAAVVARPCPVLGERVHAFVTPGENIPTEEGVRAFLAERLADYKVPESVTFLPDPLPRNSNGKIMKSTLREKVKAADNGLRLSRGRGPS